MRLNVNSRKTIEEAASDSEAIFPGTAIEERPVQMATKGGSGIGYKEVRFEVAKSWKLVDKKSVWIRIPAKRPDGCGFEVIGREYLVYANKINDFLYVSPMSRTMQVEKAQVDMQKLGANGLDLSEGEFNLFKINIYIILCVALTVFAGFISILIIYRRSGS